MSLIRVGSTSKYAEGWDSIFGGGTSAARKPAPKTARAKAAKKSVTKAARKAKTKTVTKGRKPGKRRRG